MSSLNVKSKYCRYGNWIINLSVLLCNLNIIISESKSCDGNNVTENELPLNWPCEWNNGVIPFVFDYFSTSPNKLVSLVRSGQDYVEQRSCLVFREYDPVEAAKKWNFTYLFYTYSDVLESCCLNFFTKATGRRIVLITPKCLLPSEVGHATLHGLGLDHNKLQLFPDSTTRAVIFINNCKKEIDLKDIVL